MDNHRDGSGFCRRYPAASPPKTHADWWCGAWAQISASAAGGGGSEDRENTLAYLAGALDMIHAVTAHMGVMIPPHLYETEKLAGMYLLYRNELDARKK